MPFQTILCQAKRETQVCNLFKILFWQGWIKLYAIYKIKCKSLLSFICVSFYVQDLFQLSKKCSGNIWSKNSGYLPKLAFRVLAFTYIFNHFRKYLSILICHQLISLRLEGSNSLRAS